MNFIICLVIATILSLTGGKFIKKHANALYIIATAIAVWVIAGTASGVFRTLPDWLSSIIWTPFAWGGFATALFVLVMFAGAAPHRSEMQKRLMQIRAELSIIASILTLGHNLSAGQTYFKFFFTQPGKLTGTLLWATICSLVMMCIMLPLFITSFPKIRRKMVAKNWKRLQRAAYGFYALIYVHVLLLYVPKARMGVGDAMLNVVIFSLIFLTYGVMRIRKAMKNSTPVMKRIPAVAAVAVCVGVTVWSMPKNQPVQEVSNLTAENTEETQQPEETEQLETPQEEPEQQESETEQVEQTEKTEEDINQKEVIHNVVSTGGMQTGVAIPTKEKNQEEVNTKQEEKTETKKEEPPKKEEKQPEKQETKPEPKEAPKPEPKVETYTYKDGTFTGTADGFQGPITVSVNIQKDEIKSISVTSHSEDEPFWTNGKTVITSILSAQSTNVSAVSGATFSSNGIKQAVNAALQSAKN